MRIRNGLLVSVIALLASMSAACSSELPSRPTQLLPPLAPDTGNLGLQSVPGFKVMTLVDESVINDSTLKARLARLRSYPTSSIVRVAQIAGGVDSALVLGRSLAFDVSPTRRLVFKLDRVSPVSLGYTNWHGALQGGLPGDLTLTIGPAGDLTANLTVYGPQYSSHSIHLLGGDLYMIAYIDYRKYLPD